MTYTIVVFTVKNCWWWTEELPETCRVLFQNEFEKLVQLVGFYYKNEIINWKLIFYDCEILSLTLREIQSLWVSEQTIRENIWYLRWNKGGKAGENVTINSFYNLYPVPIVIEKSTMNISWGVKAGGAKDWQPYRLHVPTVLKSVSLNLLESSRPVQACSGIAFPLTKCYLYPRGNNPWYTFRMKDVIKSRSGLYGEKKNSDRVLCSFRLYPLY